MNPEVRHVELSTALRLAVDVYAPPEDAAPIGDALFLPGFGSVRNGQKATALGPALARRGRRFLSIDYEGHGDSTGSFASLTLTRHVRDYRAVRDALARTGRHALIGSSMGGMAAALAAAEEPNRIAALVLIAPAFGFRARFEARMGPELVKEWERRGEFEYTGEFFTHTLDFSLIADARLIDEERVIRGIQCPVLLVHGVADDTVPIEESDRFAEICPAPLHYVRLDGGSHRLDDPAHLERLVSEVATFLGDRGGAAG